MNTRTTMNRCTKTGEHPLISMIIPVFNSEKYIEKCLQSLTTSMCAADAEVILIDDGSTDGSGSICDEYSRNKNLVRVIRTENRGLSEARNRGISEARGEWIAFLDSDDWIEECYISVLSEAVKTYKSEIIAFGYYEEYYNKSIEKQLCQDVESEICAGDFVQKGNYTNAVWNKIYRASLFSDVKFPSGQNYEDVTVSFQLLEKCNSITCLPNLLIHYRRRKGSIVTSYRMRDLMDCWTANYQRFTEYGEKNEGYMYETTKGCIVAAASIWCWTGKGRQKPEELKYLSQYKAIQCWADQNKNRVLKGHYAPMHKATILMLRSNNWILLKLLYSVNVMYRFARRKVLYE